MKTFMDILGDDEKTIVEQYLTPMAFSEGSRIMTEGDPGDGAYYISEDRSRAGA